MDIKRTFTPTPASMPLGREKLKDNGLPPFEYRPLQPIPLNLPPRPPEPPAEKSTPKVKYRDVASAGHRQLENIGRLNQASSHDAFAVVRDTVW